MVKSLVSKLSSASSTLSIASSFGSSHGKHHHHNDNAASSTASSSSAASTAISGDNYLKYRNDPGRFFGDGVQFKAKLIGILEVGEARGDRMCQEALQDLKMAIRAAGEHKQRITIHVTIDGLRLRDEKTGDSLYHHPVHKISFIAQDMTDSRAFGYIFGSPDSGHRFFGIKTDKAASQVVLAMRDLFQVVFELKKKEIELARQQIQSKSLHHHDTQHQLSSLSSLKSAAAGTAGQNDLSALGGSTTSAATLSMLNTMVSSSTNTPNTSRLGVNLDSKGASKEISPESVADLVDLEQELSSLQRGITQMERITPNDAHTTQTSSLTSNAAKTSTAMSGISASVGGAGGSDDPFGDSFTSFPTLPPPEPGRLRSKTTTKPNDINITNIPTTTAGNSSLLSPTATQSRLTPVSAGLNTTTVNLQPLDDDDDHWLRELDAHSDVFDTSKTVVPGLMGMPPLASTLSSAVPLASRAPLAARESSDTPPNHIYETVSCSANNMPTDMAELSSISNNVTNNNAADTTNNANNLANSSSLSDIFQTAAAESAQNSKLDIKSEPVAVSSAAATNAGADPVMLPRDTDPFSPTRKKSDPFEEGGDLFSKLDPFEFEFSSNINDGDNLRKVPTSLSPSTTDQLTGSSGASQDLLAGHLQVNLPPEGDTTQTTSTVRSRPVPSAMTTATSGAGIAPASGSAVLPPTSMLKQQTVDVISSISNKKMPHLFGQSSRFSKRDSNSINMRRLQESDSLSETETAPEPPPRPDYGICVEPPPLPPKKQFNDFVIRSRNGPSHSLSSAGNQSINSNRYDSLNSVLTSKNLTGRSANTDVPPIPLPSRRVGRTDGSYPGPGRPRKPGHTEDDYLAPLSILGSGTSGSSSTTNTNIMSDVPPLLPPPTQTSSRARTQRQQSLHQQSKAHEIYENKSEILQQIQQQQQQQQQQQNILDHHNPATAAIVPDITLTQLLTLGIDELAVKLNVPTTKLSTMTLVELTTYLSEFLEQNKPSKVEPKVETSQEEVHQHTPPIFKVNFDQEATFVAKFDDTFGEDFHQQTSSGAANTFEANFAQFDSVSVEPPVQSSNTNTNMVPPADRYAVFREIIDQELQQQQESVDLIGDVMEGEIPQVTDEKQFETSNLTDLDMNVTHQQDLLSGDMLEVSGPQPPKIDTKITEVLAQAKDRYAALRDLILVENLFDKPAPKPPSISGDMEQSESKSPFQGFSGFNDDEEDQDLRQLMDQASTLDVTTQQQRLGLVDSRGFLVEPSSSAITVEEDEDEEDEERRNNAREEAGGLSSADSNEKEQDKDTLPTTKYEQLASSNQQLEEIEEKPEKYDDNPQISITQSQMPTSNEVKYLSVVSVASSGLSGSKDDLEIDDLMHRAISNLSLDSRERNSPAIAPQQQNTHSTTTTMTPPHFNDVSTSPIPIQRSPLPTLTGQQNKSPNNKSPQQISPLPSQLTVVSQIIDAATKQIQNDAVSKTSNDSWATFDTPQHQPVVVSSDKRARPSAKLVTKANNFLNLPPPPGSISNCSQNDSAIESPCSSDPREEAWHKHTMGGSSLSLGHQGAPLGGSTSGQRRYHKKERQNTSSSSRDLSWDEDQGSIPPTHILDYPPSKRLSGQLQGSLTTDRHGYYRRHARRMNSCDDEYDYEQDYASSRRDRDQCKYKHSLSRSRDNFDMDSPGWYHHHAGAQHPHHTWSSQDIEQARGRNFERSAYERTTYGPPIYDKRGVGPPLPPTSSYDRRSAGGGVYDKRGKYYRGDSNPRSTERIYNLDDFDEMLAASGKIPAHLASMYEEMKAECCSPPGHRQRTADYMYERDRKSFDRESLESYEGSNVAPRRRRRSYDSGGIPSDPYGSCDSRDEYHGRERCVMTADKSRSLRKSLKSLRVTGDIDYDQDSEKEYHYRDQRSRCDTRSLQRPSQLTTQGVSGVGVGGVGVGGNILGSQSRIRKSSGSSPWDGEEPPLPGQKTSSWKRPSSAAEAERRRAAVKGQTPSGSDEDKDRRYRKKRTTRNKDLPAIPSSAARYGRTGNYDYISCEDLDDDAEDYVDEEEEEEDHGIEHDEISPADEDKFARLEMRRHEMHNRMMDAHVRRRKEVPPSQSQVSSMAYRKGGKGGYIRRPLQPPTEPKHPQDYGFDDDDGDDGEYEQTPTPRSNTSSALPTATPNASTKFSFDVGFESDFNQSSPPPAPAGTASSCNSTPAANVSAANTPASKSSFRFSNDFSAGQEREKHFQHPPAGSLQQYDLENRGISPQTAQTQTSTPKLRFDDNVKVSQFDDAFEDDFSKATFDAFQNDDVQWQESIQKTTKQQMRNSKLQQRQQDLIKKSESVNIFAKKVEDPFEDDEFFNSPPTVAVSTSTAGNEKTENHKTNGNGGGSAHGSNGGGGGNAGGPNAGWDDDNTNFAKFDENM